MGRIAGEILLCFAACGIVFRSSWCCPSSCSRPQPSRHRRLSRQIPRAHRLLLLRRHPGSNRLLQMHPGPRLPCLRLNRPPLQRLRPRHPPTPAL